MRRLGYVFAWVAATPWTALAQAPIVYDDFRSGKALVDSQNAVWEANAGSADQRATIRVSFSNGQLRADYATGSGDYHYAHARLRYMHPLITPPRFLEAHLAGSAPSDTFKIVIDTPLTAERGWGAWVHDVSLTNRGSKITVPLDAAAFHWQGPGQYYALADALATSTGFKFEVQNAHGSGTFTISHVRVRGTPEWQLVWSDEFDGATVDPGKWNYEVNCDGGGNQELQCYTAHTRNVQIDNGHLVIRVIREDYLGKPYTSGRLNSAGKGDWLYGRAEARIKVPCGRGLWPAFWLLPTDWAYGDWPTSGEIDVMESIGSHPETVFGTLHFGAAWPHNKWLSSTYTLSQGTFCDDYHVYAAEWFADRIDWYVDGTRYFTVRPSDADWSPLTHWPHNRRFHFVLNAAMGGTLGGEPDPSIFSREMWVDYVRFYQAEGT